MGLIAQLIQAENSTESSTTATVTNATTPTISDGYEIFSQSFTPIASDSQIEIDVHPFMQTSGSQQVAISLFEGSVCKGVRSVGSDGSEEISNLFKWVLPATDTVGRTYSVRVGPTSGTLYINRWVSGSAFGGSIQSRMDIKEILATGISANASAVDSLVQFVKNSTTSTLSTTAWLAPASTPTTSDGYEVFSQSVTPTNSGSVIEVEFSLCLDDAFAGNFPGFALFEGSSLKALGVGTAKLAGGNYMYTFRVVLPAGSTSSRTYSLRVFSNATSRTLYINGDHSGTGVLYGGSQYESIMTIKEYL